MKIKLSWNSITSFIRIMKVSYPHIVVVLLTGGIIKAALPFIGLYFSAQILNQLIKGSYEKALENVVIMLVAQLLTSIVGKICDQRMVLISENSDSIVKQRIGAKAYEMEYTLDSLRKADLSTRGMGGMGSQADTLYRLIEFGCSILYSLGFIILLFLQVDSSRKNFFNSYLSTIVLLFVYGIIIMIHGRSNKKIQEMMGVMMKKNDHINSVFGYMSTVATEQRNAKDIRVFQMHGTLYRKMYQFSKLALGGYLETAKKSGVYIGVNGFFSQISSGISYVFIGMKAVYGIIPIGNVILYAGAINRVVESFFHFAQYLMSFHYRHVALEHYERFLETPSMSYDGTLPIEKRDDGEYLFEFHDVSFSYPETGIEVLSHINLEFPVKGKTAIVGQNGAGKTTLIKLLCRLYEPTEGFITLNGIDIRKYNYQEYTKAFSVVFQDFKLFSLSLDENVAGGNDVCEERLWNVLGEVHLADRVREMEQKEKSHLYHNNGDGIDLSGGEAQRLAIARALYKDAPFIILDEPTAALDPIAEAEIYENFNEMILGKTAIYISHRMSSCKFCDRIVVLEKGMINEVGSHRELIEKQGIYAKLYETQAQYYA